MPSDAMQPDDESASEELSADPQPNSVYDFIYQDVRRIGSFLSQFDEYGVRQSIRATESTGRTEGSKTAAAGNINIPLIGGGSGTFDATISDETKDIAEYTFDPLWTNARRLLNYLSQHNLLKKEIWDTRLGSFIQLEGNLAIIDPSIAKPALKIKFVKENMRKGATADLEGTTNERNKTFDAFTEFVQIIPSSVQAHLIGKDYTAWCTLLDGSLSMSSADLALKHGSYIPGRWTLIGILDAFPDPEAEPTPENPEPKTMDDLVAEFAGTMIGSVASRITRLARDLVGRPRNYFGITPLVIFRDIAANAEEPSEPEVD